MKTLCLIAFTVLATGTAALAQTGTTAAPHFLRLLDIHSDTADFSGTWHTVTNRGHVHVTSPGFDMTCGQLVANYSELDGRVTNIVAETNVVIDATDPQGKPVHATGPKAVYDYSVADGTTNKIVTLTGNPWEVAQVICVMGGMVVTNTGDPITWDLVKNSIRVVNFHLSGQRINSETTLNPPPATNSPGADTNYPPGSLDLAPPRGNGGRGF